MAFIILLTLFIVQTSAKGICRVEGTHSLECDHIPEIIPEGIINVRITNLSLSVKNITINSTNFESYNWKFIKRLELSSCGMECGNVVFPSGVFANLESLSELHIHLQNFVTLDTNTFVGLDTVHVLDVSDCFRLSFDTLAKSLNGTNKLPALTHLRMHRLNLFHGNDILDARFGQALQDKKLIMLDMSNTAIKLLDFVVFNYLPYLEILNASRAKIKDYWEDNYKLHSLSNITLDLNGMMLPTRVIPLQVVFSNLTVKVHKPVHYLFTTILELAVLNVSSILPTYFRVYVKNITVIFEDVLPSNFLLKCLILKDNNLRYLDVKCIFTNPNFTGFTSLEEIDISHNKLEYLQTSCIPKNLISLDMSSNQLHKMADRSRLLFGKLLHSLNFLQFVSLSRNGLKTIPETMFKDNIVLRKIDLSGNQLTQVTFTMDHLNNLEVVDLQDNHIYYLDELAVSHLDSIPLKRTYEQNHATILLQGNPMSCSECGSKSFILWVLNSPLVNVSSQNLHCKMEDGHLTRIGAGVVHLVEDICNRKTIIVISCVSSACGIILGIGFARMSYKLYRLRIKLINKNIVISRLRADENQGIFAAFLLSSHSDENFVKKHILYKLDDTLTQKIETWRDYDLGCFAIFKLFRCFHCFRWINPFPEFFDHPVQHYSDNVPLLESWQSPDAEDLDQHAPLPETLPKLICTRENFTAGKSIFDETHEYFNRSYVIILYISEDLPGTPELNFLLDMVRQHKKPILFMITRNSSWQQYVPQSLRRLYHNIDIIEFTEIENDRLEPVTSWANICDVILDSAAESECNSPPYM